MGEPGDPGPAGPPGEGLVWKDASGAVVENAYPAFAGHFQMLVSNGNGAYFEYQALSGLPWIPSYDSTTFWHFYLTTNCTGEIYIDAGPMSAGLVMKYNSRLVALPADVEVQTQMGSYMTTGSTTCNHGPVVTAFVKLETLNALPTLSLPVIGPGPYHVDKV